MPKLFICVAAILFLSAPAFAADSDSAILSSTSYWRVFYTLAAPVERSGNEIKKLATLSGDTPLPPADWKKDDFDDSSWSRVTGRPLPAGVEYGAPELADSGITGNEGSSPALALMCLRGKFGVVDPASAKDLKLSVSYRGGVVVFVNGTEVGRADMAKGPGDLAEDYPKDAYFKKAGGSPMLDAESVARGGGKAETIAAWKLRNRHADIAIPATALHKGTNVIAIEVHRAAYDAGLKEWIDSKNTPEYQLYGFLWATCGMQSAQLNSSNPAAFGANTSRPKGVQIWNSQPMQQDFDLDYGDPFEPLRPMKIVGSRGGDFSGKVVVGSDSALTGLKATITDLTGAKGGKIAAGAIQIRYAMPTGVEPVAEAHYPAVATLFDAFSDAPIPSIAMRTTNLKGTQKWGFGAVCPVWVTVSVPADATAGEYTGKLTVNAGGKAFDVSVILSVSAWVVPKPSSFHTIVDLMESPESVAMQYNVPFYSDKHFKLLETSFDRLGYVGNWTVHIPLICQSNLGNAESMVRWIKKPDGRYKFDFTAMDKYLDVAEKHMGKPRIVFVVVWDFFLGIAGQAHQGLHPQIEKVLPTTVDDIPVSVLNESTGAITMETVGKYDAAGKANWKALSTELLEHLKKHGLEKSVVLGTVDDVYPTDEIVAFWKGLMPDANWGRYSHYESKGAQNGSGPPVGYQAHAYATVWGINDMEGWNRADQTVLFFRTGGFGDMAHPWFSMPLDMARLLGEVNIQGPRRGFGRVGLDFWPVLKNARGQLSDNIQGRYPKSFWRQLDMMIHCIVPPGPDGALMTSKLEMMREGLQEDEARIFLEQSKSKLSGALAAKVQAVLDERVHTLDVTMENQAIAGFDKNAKPWLDGYGAGDFHAEQAGIFRQWFMESGWQERSQKLFDVAAEVAGPGK